MKKWGDEEIKIIDLLNMISKGEEVPKKIKITILDDKITRKYNFFYDEDDQEYKDDELFPLGDRIILERVLNEKVEVIEEDKKIEIPKHIPNEVIQDLDRAICPANVKCIAHKVNEIINYLQHIKKGENNE